MLMYKYIFFGVLSGVLWALHLWQIEKVLTNNFSNLSSEFASLVVFSLSELVSLLILLILKGKGIIMNLKNTPKNIQRKYLGLLVLPLGVLSYTMAVSLMGSQNAAVVLTIYPIITLLLTLILLKKRLLRWQIYSVLLVSLGILVFNNEGNDLLQWGGLFAILAAFCWSLEAIFCEYFFKESEYQKPETLLFIRYIYSLTLALILFIICISLGYLEVSELLEVNIINIVIAAVLALLSYYFYYLTISYLGAVWAINLNITYLVWLFLFNIEDNLSKPYTMIGGILIIFAVILSTRKKI